MNRRGRSCIELLKGLFMNLRGRSGINRVLKGFFMNLRGRSGINRVIKGIVHEPEGVFRYK